MGGNLMFVISDKEMCGTQLYILQPFEAYNPFSEFNSPSY